MATDTLALLIDGDNASPKIIWGLLAELTNYGTASVRRIYGFDVHSSVTSGDAPAITQAKAVAERRQAYSFSVKLDCTVDVHNLRSHANDVRPLILSLACIHARHSATAPPWWHRSRMRLALCRANVADSALSLCASIIFSSCMIARSNGLTVVGVGPGKYRE